MHIKRGLTLVELVVIMGIVGILSAIALPLYKRYLYAARLAKAVPTIDAVLQDVANYASLHGKFPTAGELGLNADIAATTASLPGDLIENAYNLIIRDTSEAFGFPANCGQSGQVTGTIREVGRYGATFNCLLVHKAPTFVTLCMYTFIESGTGQNIFTAGQPPFFLMTDAQQVTYIPNWSNVVNASQADTLVSTFASGSSCM